MSDSSAANIEVKNAATGRTTAITGPSRPQVIATVSTLGSGVEIRKARGDSRLAPFCWSPSEIGTTPQEQIGSGSPNNDAQSALFRLRPPRKRSTPSVRR